MLFCKGVSSQKAVNYKTNNLAHFFFFFGRLFKNCISKLLHCPWESRTRVLVGLCVCMSVGVGRGTCAYLSDPPQFSFHVVSISLWF